MASEDSRRKSLRSSSSYSFTEFDMEVTKLTASNESMSSDAREETSLRSSSSYSFTDVDMEVTELTTSNQSMSNKTNEGRTLRSGSSFSYTEEPMEVDQMTVGLSKMSILARGGRTLRSHSSYSFVGGDMEIDKIQVSKKKVSSVARGGRTPRSRSSYSFIGGDMEIDKQEKIQVSEKKDSSVARGGRTLRSRSSYSFTEDDMESDKSNWLTVSNRSSLENSFQEDLISSNHDSEKTSDETSSNLTASSTSSELVPVGRFQMYAGPLLSQRLSEPSASVEDLALIWREIYRSGFSDEARRSLLELIVHSTGYNCPLTNLKAENITDLSDEIFDNVMKQPNINPPCAEDSYVKKVSTFFKLTMTRDVISRDDNFMKKISYVLRVMVDSKWVLPRYIGLMIASAITQSYIDYLAAQPKEVLPNSEEEKLKKVLQEGFEEFMDISMKGLKDKIWKTRKEMFEVFCLWFLKHPEVMAFERYLRYLYFGLFYDNFFIRHLALKTIRLMLTCDCEVENFPLFVEKTLPIVIRRIQDESSCVGVTAMETVTEVYAESSELFEGLDMTPVFRNVFSANLSIATVAAACLKQKLHGKGKQTNLIYIWNVMVYIDETLDYLRKECNIDCEINVLVDILVDNILHHFFYTLTDWRRWLDVFFQGREKASVESWSRMMEIASVLLLSILNNLSLHAGVESKDYFPPPPVLDERLVDVTEGKKTTETKKAAEAKKRVISKEVAVHYLEQVTKHIGPKMLEIWDCIKESKPSLSNLLAIPQYFSASIEVENIKEICFYLVNYKSHDSKTMLMKFCSFSHLHLLMTSWRKFFRLVPIFELVLFDKVKDFGSTCHRIAECALSTSDATIHVLVLKELFYLTKHFNLNKTTLLEDALDALKNVQAKQIPEIVCPTTMMILYMLQWEVKEVIEMNISDLELHSRLIRIKRYSQTLLELLDELLRSKVSAVRENAYFVIARLYSLLWPTNVYTRRYPSIHLEKPSILTMEWLNYCLICMAPLENVPADNRDFDNACKAVTTFCSLLLTGVIDITYFSSVLPYFRFYKQAHNYNHVLEGPIQILSQRNVFPLQITQSLILIKGKTDDNLEEMMSGFASIVIYKLRPLSVAHENAVKITSSCIQASATPINSPSYHILPLVVPLIKFLCKEDKIKLLELVKNHNLDENDKYVNSFLAVLRRKIGAAATDGGQQTAAETADVQEQ